MRSLEDFDLNILTKVYIDLRFPADDEEKKKSDVSNLMDMRDTNLRVKNKNDEM